MKKKSASDRKPITKWEAFQNFFYRVKHHRDFKRLIEGQRVLILGSGPSSAEITAIPQDVRIFTLKHGLKLLDRIGVTQPIALFLCWRGHLLRNPFIESFLPKFHSEVILTDFPDTLQNKNNLSNCYTKIIREDGRYNFYAERLIGRDGLKKVIEKVFVYPDEGKKLKHASSGVRLLQYALYFQAREIYVAGIDLNDEGYFTGEYKKQKHIAFDRSFLEILSKKNHSNVFSISPKSPLTQYFPHRPLTR